jgi:hypothetical protein
VEPARGEISPADPDARTEVGVKQFCSSGAVDGDREVREGEWNKVGVGHERQGIVMLRRHMRSWWVLPSYRAEGELDEGDSI